MSCAGLLSPLHHSGKAFKLSAPMGLKLIQQIVFLQCSGSDVYRAVLQLGFPATVFHSSCLKPSISTDTWADVFRSHCFALCVQWGNDWSLGMVAVWD